MEKIPCIECTLEIWEYVEPYLMKWGYITHVSFDYNFTNFPLLVINTGGSLGLVNNINLYKAEDYSRELVTNVEEFLERAAKLKGFTYKRKDIMKINDIEVKPGMVITTEDKCNYIAFPTKEEVAFVNASFGGCQSDIPSNIIRIQDLSEGICLDSGKILWEKPKELVITMDEIAKKFGYSVDQIKIMK